jgi:HPt (histidine-containing phosphotransfer) domain-containing protein
MPPPIDLDHLHEIAAGDTEFLLEMARTFMDDTARRTDYLRELLEAGDAEALQAEAYTVRGSCSDFCADRLCELASELEQVGAGGDLSEGAAILDAFAIEFERLRSYAARKLAA